MSQPLTTQYMQLHLPTVEISNDYVNLIANAFSVVDGHNHANVGKHLSEKSILWTDFNLDSQSLNNASLLNFTALFGAPVVLQSIFFLQDNSGIDLFYKNSTGNIRITENGATAFVSIVDGFLGNFSLKDAVVRYDLPSNSYTFSLGSNFGNLHAHGFNIATDLIGTELLLQISGVFSPTSTGYFFNNNSVLCTEGSPEAEIKFQSTQIGLPIDVSTNPRLLTTVDRFNNVQTIPNIFFRQTRYGLGNPSPFPLIDPTSIPGSCVISVSTGTLVQAYANVLDGQNPAQEVYAQNTTPFVYQQGAAAVITPSFNGTIGRVVVSAAFNTGSANPFSNPLIFTGNKMLSLTFLVDSTVGELAISFFNEFHGFDPTPVIGGNFMTWNGEFIFELIDTATNLPVTNYRVVVRI